MISGSLLGFVGWGFALMPRASLYNDFCFRALRNYVLRFVKINLQGMVPSFILTWVLRALKVL